MADLISGTSPLPKAPMAPKADPKAPTAEQKLNTEIAEVANALENANIVQNGTPSQETFSADTLKTVLSGSKAPTDAVEKAISDFKPGQELTASSLGNLMAKIKGGGTAPAENN